MSGPEPTPRTFLVAEEDAVQRTLRREVPATLGPGRVDEAGDGPSAPAQAQARRPDLILLDYELPPAGGGAVVAGLRADAALAGVPVLVSAYSDGPADPGGGEATGGRRGYGNRTTWARWNRAFWPCCPRRHPGPNECPG